jgi:hypothetical protein
VNVDALARATLVNSLTLELCPAGLESTASLAHPGRILDCLFGVESGYFLPPGSYLFSLREGLYCCRWQLGPRLSAGVESEREYHNMKIQQSTAVAMSTAPAPNIAGLSAGTFRAH